MCLRFGVGVFCLGFDAWQVSLYWLFLEECTISITISPESGNTIHAQTNIQRNNFRLKLNCERLKCFLHIQLTKRNARLPKIHRVHRNWFRIFKITSKIWVLKQSQSPTVCRKLRIHGCQEYRLSFFFCTCSSCNYLDWTMECKQREEPT